MTKFGIEIECFNVEQIPDSIPESWAEHDDGSINGHNSLEIVSPPLMVSNESFRQIKDVMKSEYNVDSHKRQLLDELLLPNNYILSNWISLVVGLVILIITHYATKELM